jgi:hypothetical protein
MKRPGALWRIAFAAASITILAGSQLAIAASGTPLPADAAQSSAAGSAGVDDVLAARLLALDPMRISDGNVRDLLARVPAPRIILLSGSVPLVTMEPFARFLVAMGYPEASIRDPANGAWWYSSYESSTDLAGTLAWYYERDGMMPMLIGHSQGGMLVSRTLFELAGAFGATVPVRNPLTGETLARTEIVDPIDGGVRPVVGLKVPYAAALATGKLPRLLLGQWTMLAKLRDVPDTVDEFTGFLIEWDPIAGTFPGAERYAASGTATVRTVTLPSSYSHIGLPRTLHLATNAVTRAWIDAYTPEAAATLPQTDPEIDTTNLLHAADIWFSIKKHWCLEAQRLVRSRMAAHAAQGAGAR